MITLIQVERYTDKMHSAAQPIDFAEPSLMGADMYQSIAINRR